MAFATSSDSQWRGGYSDPAFGGLGDFSVYFHAVVAGANCVALIYDTRYQEGQQYCPPYDPARHADGLPIRITVPHADRAKTRTYETKYFGQKFVLGVLDVILVVTNPSGEEE